VPQKHERVSETVFPPLDHVSGTLYLSHYVTEYSLRDFWRHFGLCRAAAHSDCCFFLRRVQIFLLTYLFTDDCEVKILILSTLLILGSLLYYIAYTRTYIFRVVFSSCGFVSILFHRGELESCGGVIRVKAAASRRLFVVLMANRLTEPCSSDHSSSLAYIRRRRAADYNPYIFTSPPPPRSSASRRAESVRHPTD